MPVRMFGVLTEPVQKIPPEARISPSNHTLDTGHVPKKKDNKKSPKTRIKNGFSDKLCVCFTLKKQKKQTRSQRASSLKGRTREQSTVFAGRRIRNGASLF